jgi:hypothetical protein
MLPLKPCPNCKHEDYEYGFSFLRYAGEAAEVAARVYVQDPTVIGHVIKARGAGLGVFSLPRLFYNGVFLGLDGDPLLVCSHCKSFVVRCHKCHSFMILDDYPGTAELVECGGCKVRFQPSESTDEFTKALKESHNSRNQQEP